MRRNADRRRRRRERGFAATGNLLEAERYLWEIARQGQWFIPPSTYRPGLPYLPSRINEKRAHWVRLLGYLGWQQTADFQAMVAQQPPRRAVSYTTDEGREVLEPARPQHLLGQARPFRQIGPKIAEGIGREVMVAMAAAACEAVIHLADVPQAEDLLREGVAAANRLQRTYVAWFSHETERDEEGTKLYHFNLNRDQAILHQLDRQFMGRGQKLSVSHARDAVMNFLRGNAINRYDTIKWMSEAIFNAIYALAFACDEEKGVQPTRGMRMRRDWNDQYGYRPSRGCVANANRVMKRVMLEPALLAIAGSFTREPSNL